MMKYRNREYTVVQGIERGVWKWSTSVDDVVIKGGKQVQEQTQIIATAIGKPAAKAPKIVKVNAESRFASGRTLSNDMSLTPPRG
jgi:hypothetical protein